MPDFIKIYGERNTGTKYLNRLIQLNIDVRAVSGVVPRPISRLQNRLPGDHWVKDLYFRLTFAQNLGWKHSTPLSPEALRSHPLVARGIAFVTLTKNPYAWLLSLHRRPYARRHGRESTFEEFLESPWMTPHRENAERRLPNPIELWNRKNTAYLGLRELGGLNVTSEDLLRDPAEAMRRIREHFGLRAKSDGFANYEESTKEAGKDNEYYRDYYLNERWRSELSEAAVRIVDGHVDHALMEQFGYAVLSH